MRKALLKATQTVLVTGLLVGNLAAHGQSSSSSAKEQVPQKVLDHLKKNQKSLQLSNDDLADMVLSSQSESKNNGLKHYYIQQRYQGIEIFGAITNVHVGKDGQLINMGNRFQHNLDVKAKSTARQPQLDAPAAIAAAARSLKLSLKAPLAPTTQSRGANRAATYTTGGISLRPIPAKLVYMPMADGQLVLAWEVSIYELDARNWWNIRVDATTGAVLDRDNLVVECNFDNDGPGGHALYHGPAAAPFSFSSVAANPTTNAFNVYAIPAETPSHGARTFVSTSVADGKASPMGWNSILPGTTFSITRGNNVYAYEDPDNLNVPVPGSSPDAGPSMLFNFPVDFTKQPVTYKDAATTNLFYMNNIMHDIWYQYGFDEASGNFQMTNPNALQGLGGDAVMAESQDSRNVAATRNNANFATPTDGQAPRMQMYLWSGLPDPNLFRVTAPASIAGTYASREASFSKPLTSTAFLGKLVLAQSTPPASPGISEEGCGAYTNASAISGNIAVVYRGNCSFADKVQNAQSAGASAVVVINNAPGDPISMGGTPTNPTPAITIPAVMISMEAGQLIRQQLDVPTQVDVVLKNSGGLPELDGDFDNGIIAHEYGHGISTRLTGGPGNSSCLNNAEQGGEGWSDWFGLMLTIKAGDTSVKPRGIGTYVQNQPTSGRGIRPSPYSTDFAVNSFTYGATNNPVLTQPHGIGFVWATMLWDMTWAFVDKYGYDENLYSGKGGNNMAMQLVIDGLKMQVCKPGFVDARDAILAADRVNYGGANQQMIWKVFAKRGLGFSAQQGLNTSRTDQVEAFDMPPVYACAAPTIAVLRTSSVQTNGPATTIYKGYGPQSVQLQANSSGPGMVSYTWSPAAGLSNASIANPVFTPSAPGVYKLTVTSVNSNNCSASESVTITVVDVRCGPANDKVLVCHNGKDSKCVKSSEVQSHLNHGDMLGTCDAIPEGNSFANQNAAANSRLTSAPNPATAATVVSFSLLKAGTYRLEVLNMQGAVVAVLGEGAGEAGQRFNYPFAKGRLSGQLYVVRLITGQGNQFTRIQFKD